MASHISQVTANDIAECRATLRTPLIRELGLVGKGVSACYLYDGQAVPTWNDFYKATLREESDGKWIMVEYAHETSVHQEYVRCWQIEFGLTPEHARARKKGSAQKDS